MKFNKVFSKCATVLTTAMVLGQVALTPIQALATEGTPSTEDTSIKETTESTTEESNSASVEATNESEPVQEVQIPEISIAPPTNNAIDNFLASQPLVSSGFTAEGDQITFNQRMISLFREIGNSTGKLTKYYSDTMYISTPYIDVTGEESGAVWCIKPDSPFPVNVEYAKKVYHDEGVYNILYYALQKGWDQPNENYVDVFVALNAYLGHSYQGVDLTQPVLTSDPNVAFLLQKAKDKDAPTGKFSINNKVQTASFDQKNKQQITDWYTPVSDGHDVTYDIPTNEFDKEVTVELDNGQTFSGQSGTKTVSSDVKFRLKAPANYTKKLDFTVNTNQKNPAALIFEPVNVDAQSVVKAGWLKDPLKVENVQATFFARQGKFKLKKTSEISNLPMEAVGFVVKLSNGETLELETKADGYTAESKDYDFGTIGEVTEVKTPAGYVALDKPIQFTIVAGETIEVAIENKVQKGKLIFQKFEEVYNPQETWEAGKPIYDRNPVANREFDLVRVNDHTLPDGKTIVGKQGEVVDHIVTDKDGNGSSNLELYIGSQNKYKLVETNTPENYRDPSAVQTEFSIPYGNNTEKLVLFDQGEIDNELKTTNITFNKKNALDLSGLNLAGAEFLVQGVTNDVKFKLTTETTGSLLKVLADKGTATYTFTEVKRPDGFGQVTGDTDTRIVTVTDGQDMTIDWENMPIMPKIGTKAHGENGEKDFDPTVDNTLYDSIHYEGVEVGKEKTLVTKIVEVGTGKIIKEIEGQITFDKQAGTHVVETFIPANTIKENTKTVFLEYLYNDKEKKEEYAKHDDLNDQDQTVTWTKPELKIETLFATVDGGKVIDPTVDNKLADKVKASNVPTNKELTILTQYIDSVTGTVISKEEHQRKFDSKEEEFTVFLDLPKNTLKDGQELVATHIIYEDKEKTKEVGRHYDLTNKDQTVTAKTPKTPTTPAQSTPTKGSFPSTGEMIQSTFAMIGLMILTVVGYFFVSKKAEAELA